MKNKDNNENIISFYPLNESTYEFAPHPMPAAKNMPSWYRDQPGAIDDGAMLAAVGQPSSTVKKCMPIFDAITGGYIIVAPMDIFVDATNPDKLQFQAPLAMGQFKGDMFATHDRQQYANMPMDPNRYHRDLLRIMPFWAVSTPKGFSTMFLNPLHRDASPLTAIPGIIDTDGFPSDGHLSFMVEKNFKGIIKQGTPLVQVFPVRRDNWKMEIRTPEESAPFFKRLRLNLRSTFNNGYKQKFRSPKEYK
jgi:hypothetical protein